ncbi:MAG: hypothetical protein GY822_20100 [Deltaproteobacteria bacterium]|nr:hypothetical protein [Deltaproteobacteria bacterium]
MSLDLTTTKKVWAMAKKKREDRSGTEQSGFGAMQSAFQDLGFTASEPTESTTSTSSETEGEMELKVLDDAQLLNQLQQNAQLQEEKKGRGGMWVTVAKGLLLDEKELERLVKLLGKKMGCNVFLEGTDIILSGRQKNRIEELQDS